MSKVKVKRNKPSIDMTPMVDLAFLLVTFFMLTTNFRSEEPITVSTPSSISELKLPVTNVMVISITGDDRVFFDLSGQPNRVELLGRIGNKYGIQFTDAEKATFAVMSSVGVPIGSLKQFLSLSSEERKTVDQPGIPVDSTKNQLKDWISLSRLTNPKARIAVKGDQDAAYPVVDKVITTVQDAGVNRFNLITDLEKGTS